MKSPARPIGNTPDPTPQQILHLPIFERLEVIRHASGKNKYDLLISMPDMRNIARRLPPQDLFLMLKEVGFDHVPALLSVVSPKQFEAFIDLDCWDKDSFSSDSFLPWLQSLLEAGEDQTADIIASIDSELICLAIGKYIKITAGPEDFDNEDSENPRRVMGLYDIEYLDPETAKSIQLLLDILYRLDNPVYLRLMESIRAEIPATLEEDAYRFSSNRLEDLGFFSYHEARKLFSYVDPQSFSKTTEQKYPFPVDEEYGPSTYAISSLKPRGILAEVLSMGIDPETVNELTLLLNRYLSAERSDKGDIEQAGVLAGETFNYLNIALEYLAGTDNQIAHSTFSSHYLIDLFRLGFSITIDLHRQSQKAAEGIIDWLDEPFASFVEALSEERPQLHAGIIDDQSTVRRPFKSLREVRVAQRWIQHINVQRRLFLEKLPFAPIHPEEIDLNGCQPATADDLTLSTIFLTAMANRIMHDQFSLAPVDKDLLFQLVEKTFGPEGVAEDLRADAISYLESLLPEAGSFADFALSIWQEEFAELDPTDIQPNYIGSLIIKT